MKRALPERFPEKFRDHGVVPTQGQFLGKWRGTCLACALGIEAIDGSDITTTQALFPYPNDQPNWMTSATSSPNWPVWLDSQPVTPRA